MLLPDPLPQEREQQQEDAQQRYASAAAAAAAQRLVTPRDVRRVQQRSQDSLARRSSLVADKEERLQRRSLVQAQLLAQVGLAFPHLDNERARVFVVGTKYWDEILVCHVLWPISHNTLSAERFSRCCLQQLQLSTPHNLANAFGTATKGDAFAPKGVWSSSPKKKRVMQIDYIECLLETSQMEEIWLAESV